MKKIFMVILFAVMTFTACTQFMSETPTETVSNETFSKVALFNPNSTKVKLISVVDKTSRSANAVDEKEVCEIEPLETKEVELGSEHEYYFIDDEGNKIANLEKSKDRQYLPVYLELNEPKEGKEYLLLSEYKTDNLLQSYNRYRNDGTTYETYELLLYEVVNADDLDAYKYNADTYIRTYPSANYWIDSKDYVFTKIGTKIIFNSDFKNNMEPISNSWVAWGWSTRNEKFDKWFCHRVVSQILHARDGNTYIDKPKKASTQTLIQAVYSENYSDGWGVNIPATETTKWKVTEIWFYSTQTTQKLYYEVDSRLEEELRKKIEDCRLRLIPLEKSSYIEKSSYNGWMPQNCEYALCMRLESKNCYEQDVWCETIETSVLREVYNMMTKSVLVFQK